MPANLRRAEAEFADLSLSNVEFATTVEDAVRHADLAIDFVPDELESKLEIFCLVDRMAPPKTILCTPSSALSITDLASCTYRAERCFAVQGDLESPGTVRVVRPAGADTSATDKVAAFFQTVGFSVVVEADSEMPMLVKNVTIPRGPQATDRLDASCADDVVGHRAKGQTDKGQQDGREDIVPSCPGHLASVEQERRRQEPQSDPGNLQD